MSPRYFYGFKPVKKSRRVPLSTVLLLSPRNTHSSFVGASLRFNVKLNRERARDRVVPRLRLKEVRRIERYRRLLGKIWRIENRSIRNVIQFLPFVASIFQRRSSIPRRGDVIETLTRIPNVRCSLWPRMIWPEAACSTPSSPSTSSLSLYLSLSRGRAKIFQRRSRFSGKHEETSVRSFGRSGKFKFRGRGLNGANVSTRSCPPVYGGGEMERKKRGRFDRRRADPIFEIQNVARIDRLSS